MSGIVGLYRLDGQHVDHVDLDRMIAAIKHRGPDGTGAWHEEAVGLGHLLLHTTPESLYEDQPLKNTASHCVITADARVDNREELLALLELQPSRKQPITDSELILAAYEKWGLACPEKILGDFAFAIWDGRQQHLFCARDHFGARPFYYHHAPGKGFFLASEIKALLQFEEVPAAVNKLEVAKHLTGAPIPKDARGTYYQAIFCLAPAHSLVLDQSGLRVHCYWQLDPTRELKLSSDEEYAEAFRTLFAEAVRCRLRSAFPLGATLSGGLDSSSISCMAAELLAQQGQDRLHTFSAVFEDVPESDERIYIESVLAKHDFISHYFHADKVSPLSEWEDILWHLDGAQQAGNLYLNWNLYKAAKTKGVRVMLEGFDGDTVVSHGIGFFSELAFAGRWFTLVRELKAYTQHTTGQPWKPTVRVWMRRSAGLVPALFRRTERLVGAGRAIFQPAPVESTLPVPARQPLPTWMQGINPDFAQEIAPYIERPAIPRTEREDHYRLLLSSIAAHALETLNACAASFGMEPCFPFFDKRLVEFCLALPPEQKISKGISRRVFRRAMKGILPEHIRERTHKSRLEPALSYTLLAYEQKYINDILQSDNAYLSEYVDIACIQEKYARWISGKSSSEDRLLIWNTVSLALWLQGMNPEQIPV